MAAGLWETAAVVDVRARDFTNPLAGMHVGSRPENRQSRWIRERSRQAWPGNVDARGFVRGLSVHIPRGRGYAGGRPENRWRRRSRRLAGLWWICVAPAGGRICTIARPAWHSGGFLPGFVRVGPLMGAGTQWRRHLSLGRARWCGEGQQLQLRS